MEFRSIVGEGQLVRRFMRITLGGCIQAVVICAASLVGGARLFLFADDYWCMCGTPFFLGTTVYFWSKLLGVGDELPNGLEEDVQFLWLLSFCLFVCAVATWACIRVFLATFRITRRKRIDRRHVSGAPGRRGASIFRAVGVIALAWYLLPMLDYAQLWDVHPMYMGARRVSSELGIVITPMNVYCLLLVLHVAALSLAILSASALWRVVRALPVGRRCDQAAPQP